MLITDAGNCLPTAEDRSLLFRDDPLFYVHDKSTRLGWDLILTSKREKNRNFTPLGVITVPLDLEAARGCLATV